MGVGGTARPTKADVARLANVSTATVSYVLNDAKGRSISAQTRENVRRAAQQLGYRPNLAARNLARGGSGVVLFVVPRVALGEVAVEVGSRMTTELARRGVMQILVFETEDDHDVVDAIAGLDPVAVTGLFPLAGDALRAVTEAGIPQFHLGSGSLHAVGELHLLAGRMRIEHLAARGHRKLAYAYSDRTIWRPVGDYWLTGLRAAAAARDLPEFTVATIDAPTAARVVADWVEQGVTAVCAQSDDVAFVVQHGIREAGLRCPADLAVIGVDAIPLGEVAAPPLTSVLFNVTAIVETAAAALLSELGYPTLAAVPTAAEIATLLPRDST